MENRQRGRYSQQAAIDELKRRNLWGYVEPILTMGSAIIAEPVSGMAGLAALPYGSEAATRAINRTQEAMTYQPRTQEGENALKIIGDLFQPVGDAFIGASEYLGDAAYNATGSPTLGAAAYSAPTMALELLGLKGASKLSKGHKAYEMGDISNYTKGLGGKQRGIFAGVKAKGADLDAMAAAKELQKRGLSRDEIWQKTGWFEDVDGAWKWEIDDSQAGFIGKARLNELAEKDPYGVVDLSSKDAIPHAELLKNYPDERQLVSYDKNSTDYFGASHNPRTQEIVLGAGLDDAQMKSAALHETQHAIQEREGFARGGSPDQFTSGKALYDLKKQQVDDFMRDYGYSDNFDYDLLANEPELYDKLLKEGAELGGSMRPFYEEFAKRNLSESDATWFAKVMDRNDKELSALRKGVTKDPVEAYKRLAGEAEARNVQTRLDFTPEQRRATPPWQTLDVPEDELIVRRDGGVAHALDRYYRGTTGQDTEAGITWVTKDKNLASEYAEHQGFRLGAPSYVEMIDADVKNPLRFRHAEQRKPIGEFLGEIMHQLDDGVGEFIDEDLASQQYKRIKNKYSGSTQEINQYWRDPEVKEFIKNAQFDAIEVPEMGANGVMTYGLIGQ